MPDGSTPKSRNDFPGQGLLTGILAFALFACGGRDPILDRADELAHEQGVVATPDPRPATSGTAGSPPPGQPEQPAPGVPEEPKPGGIEIKGPSVVLSGTVEVPDWKGGPIRIDVFDGDQQAAANSTGQRPRVVAMARLEKPGPFDLRVPSTATQVWVGAYADENSDGKPDPTDPEAWFTGNPVSTGTDHPGVDLQLTTTPSTGSVD